jgi:hypothetical protein
MGQTGLPSFLATDSCPFSSSIQESHRLISSNASLAISLISS